MPRAFRGRMICTRAVSTPSRSARSTRSVLHEGGEGRGEKEKTEEAAPVEEAEVGSTGLRKPGREKGRAGTE